MKNTKYPLMKEKNIFKNISFLTEIPNVEFKISSLIFYEYSVNSLSKILQQQQKIIKVLDIGCSSGYGIHIMREICPNYFFVGIDISENEVFQAQRLLSKYSNTVVHKMDITKHETVQYLISKYGQFDAITCFEVFEHIPHENSVMMMKNIYSLLSNDGLLFISTPNKRVYDIDAYTYDHINEVNVEDFLSLLEELSFEIIQVMGSRYVPPLLTSLLYRYNLVVRSGDIKNELPPSKKLFRHMLCALLDPKRIVMGLIRRINFKWFLKLKAYEERLINDYINSSLVYVIARKRKNNLLSKN